MTKNTDLEGVASKKRDQRFDDLLRRLERCEDVANQYAFLFSQLEAKMKALADRHGNVQAVYDYMVKVGSTIVTKKIDHVAFLNPNCDPKRIDEIKKKYEVGDTVYYADESKNKVTMMFIKSIDVIGKHPRYILEGLFGYVDESKLFKTEKQAQWQLDEWRGSV